MSAHGLTHHVGASWTTDAPYRETRREVATYRDEGVKTVEMEAAALFAVAHCCHVQATAVFVVGDRLADLVWQPADDRRVRRGLQVLADAVVELLRAE